MPRHPTSAELAAMEQLRALPPPTLLQRLLPSTLLSHISPTDPPLSALTPLFSPTAHPLAHAALLSATAHPSLAPLAPRVARVISLLPPPSAASALALASAAIKPKAPVAPAICASLLEIAAASETEHWTPALLTVISATAHRVYATDPSATRALPLPQTEDPRPTRAHTALLVAAAASLDASGPNWRRYAAPAACGLVALANEGKGEVVAAILSPSATRAIYPLLPSVSSAETIAELCLQRALHAKSASVAVQAAACAGALAPGATLRRIHAIAVLHPQRGDTEGVSAQRMHRVRLLLTAIATVGEASRTAAMDARLGCEEALIGIDALARLGVSPSSPPRREVLWLAANVAGDAVVLGRLAVLAAAVTVPPSASPAHAAMLLHVLGLSLAARIEGKTRKRVHGEESEFGRGVSDESRTKVWRATGMLLRSVLATPKGEVHVALRQLVRGVLVRFIAARVLAVSDAVDLAFGVWGELLTAYGNASLQLGADSDVEVISTDATDIAHAQDVFLSGTLPHAAALSCVRRLELAAAAWKGAERSKIGVVLVLRAALRCELSLLPSVLAVAGRMVRCNPETFEIARQAVLNADAVRKGALVQWFYGDLTGGSAAGPSRRVAEEVELRRVAKL